jgi:hypothetical protein
MDAGRSPAVFRCPCDSASETAEFSVSRALKAPDGPHMVTGGKRRHLGDPSRLRGAGRDEVNNPLYWRFAPTARGLSGLSHTGLK